MCDFICIHQREEWCILDGEPCEGENCVKYGQCRNCEIQCEERKE